MTAQFLYTEFVTAAKVDNRDDDVDDADWWRGWDDDDDDDDDDMIAWVNSEV